MNIDERLEALTHSVELLASFHKDRDRDVAEQQKSRERHDREMAEIRAVQAKTDRRLDRAIQFAVRDARRQRAQNAEFEAGVARLNSAFAAFLERGGNGKH